MKRKPVVTTIQPYTCVTPRTTHRCFLLPCTGSSTEAVGMPSLLERRGATLIHSRVPLRQMRVCTLPRSIQYRTEASPVLHKHVKCHAQRNIPLSLEADEETSELRPVKHPRGDWDRRWAVTLVACAAAPNFMQAEARKRAPVLQQCVICR